MRGIVRGLAMPGGGGGGGGGITALNFSAGTTSQNISDSIVFADSNNISFGLNGSTITASAAAGGGGITNIRVSAGTTSNLLSAFTFNNANGISFGLDASTITGSVATSLTNFRVSAGTTSNLLSALTFADSNGLAFGINASTITGSYTVPTVTNSSWTVSDAATSGTVGRLAFTNLNGVTLSLSTGAGGSHTIVGSITSQSVQTQGITGDQLSIGVSTGGNTAGNTTVNSGQRIVFVGSNGITLSQGTGAGSTTITISGVTTAAQTNQQMTMFATGNTTQSSTGTTNASSIIFRGDGLVSVGITGGSIEISGTQSNQAFSAAGGASNFQTLSFADTNSVSWTNTNGSIGVASVKLQMFAVSNTTQSSSGTANHTALSFGGAGIASVGVTGGSVVISVPSGGGAGDGGNTIAAGTRTASSSAVLLFSDSNNFTWGLNAVNGTVMTASYSESVQTMGLYAIGNTTQNSSTTLDARTMSFNGLGAATWGYSNGSIQVSVPATSSLVGASGFTVSTAGSTISVAPILVSSYENMEGLVGSTLMAITTGSVSHAVFFNVPNAVSFSFMRIPVLMTTNSTTIATLASATASASGGLSSTWNAVIYSLGTGANSKSLQSVTSGTTGFSFSQRISVTNSTQASYSLGFSAQANGAGTTRTTQYSVSNTNYSFTTDQIATEFSSARMLDIPFAGSLTHGPYWLVLGMSSSTNTGGAAGLAALTNCNVRYSGHYGASQADLSFGIMGSTDRTSGGLMGAGSFSTAGGGTTNSIPISAISSIASLARVYFQLLRSA